MLLCGLFVFFPRYIWLGCVNYKTYVFFQVFNCQNVTYVYRNKRRCTISSGSRLCLEILTLVTNVWLKAFIELPLCPIMGGSQKNTPQLFQNNKDQKLSTLYPTTNQHLTTYLNPETDQHPTVNQYLTTNRNPKPIDISQQTYIQQPIKPIN